MTRCIGVARRGFRTSNEELSSVTGSSRIGITKKMMAPTTKTVGAVTRKGPVLSIPIYKLEKAQRLSTSTLPIY